MKKNELGMREITRDEATEQGVNLSMVKTCRTLRRLANLGRLTLDDTVHRSGLNRHLFHYIEYCGMTPLEYVKQYLANLQPYMLERKMNQEKQDNFLCILDNLYRVSIYIKVDNTFGEEMVVSFHEDNIRGVAKTNDLIQNPTGGLVPVFADSYGSIDQNTGNVSLKVMAQRGMKVLPLSVVGVKCEDVFLVRQQDIDNQFLFFCNEYIRDLYTSNLNLDFDQVEIFSILQQISFTSYGRDTFSSISLLIDSLTTQKDALSKQAADFALITFAGALKLTEEQKRELIGLLEEKYLVTSIKAIDDILYRVKVALQDEGDGEQDRFLNLKEGDNTDYDER